MKAKAPRAGGSAGTSAGPQSTAASQDKPAPPPFTIMPTEALSDRSLLESDLRVLGALCSFFNRKDFRCFPGHRAIAERAGVALATAKRALERLRDLGYVGWEPDFGPNGGRRSNRYSIPALGEDDSYYGGTPPLPQVSYPPAVVVSQGVVPDVSQPLAVVVSYKQTKEQTNELTNLTPRFAQNGNPKTRGSVKTEPLTEEQKRKGPAYDPT